MESQEPAASWRFFNAFRPFYNILGEFLALLGKPLLIDDSEDRNNVRKVFLIVPTG
jgi:hypothetical protein